MTQVEVPAPPPDLGSTTEPSALASARLRRRITIEQAAAQAGLTVDEVRSLEENRVWRFPSTGDAIAVAIVYATSLGVSAREARRLARLPVGRRLIEAWSLRRWLAVLAFAAACLAILWFVLGELRSQQPQTVVVASSPASEPAAPLPQRWQIQVDVYNGTREGGAATRLADQVAGLAYKVGAVGNARRRDYEETRVYFPPGGRPIAERLARELGVKTAALPDGDDPRRLVVIVGTR